MKILNKSSLLYTITIFFAANMFGAVSPGIEIDIQLDRITNLTNEALIFARENYYISHTKSGIENIAIEPLFKIINTGVNKIDKSIFKLKTAFEYSKTVVFKILEKKKNIIGLEKVLGYLTIKFSYLLASNQLHLDISLSDQSFKAIEAITANLAYGNIKLHIALKLQDKEIEEEGKPTKIEKLGNSTISASTK